MLGLGGTPGGVPLAAHKDVSLVAPVGVPPPPDDIRPLPPDGSPLTAPDGFPPPPPPNDLPLVASDDLHLSHSKKWTRIIADEDFRFPQDTKTEVLRQKWRRMRKDDPKLSILLSGPSRLADEMLGLGGTPGGVPLAALEGVSLVAPVGVPPPPNDICPPPPDGSPLTAPDRFPPPPPPNDLPLVASDDLHLRTLMAQRQQRAAPFVFTPQLELDLKRGVYRHNSHSNKWTRIIADEDFRFPPNTKTEVLWQKWRRMCKDDPKLSIILSGPSRLADEMLGLGGTPGGVPLAALKDVSLVAPVGVPPPPDDICPPPPDGSPLTAPDGFPPPPPPNDLPLVASDDLHLSHSKKWTRIIADEDFRFPQDTKTEVLRQKWRRMRKDDPKLSIILSGPSRLADEMLGLGGTPGGVPLAALKDVSLVAPVGVPPPPDDICPLPPDGSPLTAPDGFPPPPPPNDLPLVASDDLHLSHSKKWTRIIADEDFRFPQDTKTEVLRQKWRRMRKDDPKLSILLSGPSRLADEMLGLGGTPGGVPLAALEGVSLVAPVGVPPPPNDICPPPPDGSPLTAPDRFPPPPPPNDLPLVASDDLHLSHSNKWTRIIADEDFRFPPNTKTEVLWQKWRRMCKDDPKLSIILSGPSRLADEMLGLGGTPGGVPLAALKDVSLVAPVGVPPPPDDICPPPPDGSPLTAPDGFPPPPPPNDLPLVASDDLHLRYAQRQQRAAPFVFTLQLELDLKRGVYRHNSHSKKWTRIIADEDFRFPQDTKTEVLRQKWRRMRKDDPKLSIILSGPSRLADEMLGLGGTPGGVPLTALEGVSLVAPVGVPPPPNDICPPPPDGSPLTAPDRFPPPPPPNDLPLVASDDLHLRTLMAQRQQRAAPFVFTPQLKLDLKRGVYRHNSHSNKWTRIIADEDFRFPPNTKTEVLWQKWRRMRKDDPKLSIILSGPSRLADEMLGLGGTPGGVPLAALKDVSLVAPVGVPPPPDDICPPPPDGSPLTAPDGFPPPPPPNDLPLVASDDLHLRTLMAQRQQRAAPFVFTPQLELDLKRGVYRHNSHNKKWTRIIADEDFRFPQDTKTEVLRQKWRRMRKDDPKLSILLSGPSRLADEMLGLGVTPGGVPLAALEGVSLVAPVGVPPLPDDICPPPPDGSPLTAPDGFPPPPPPNDLPLVASDDLHLSKNGVGCARMIQNSIILSGPSRLADEMLGLGGTSGGVPLAALEDVSLVAPVGVPPPPDDICPPPPDGSPLTAPDGVPCPPPPPNDLPLVASDDLHLRTLMAQRQQRATPFVFTPQLELDLKRGVYRHNNHIKKWARIIADEDFRFPPDTKTEVLRQKWRRMRKDDPKLSILLSGPSRLADEMLGLGGTPGGVPLAALEGVSLVAPVGVPPLPDDICPPPPDGSPLTAPDGFLLLLPPNDLPLVASDDLHLRTLMAQRQQRATPFVFTPQLELDLKCGVYRHNNHIKKWARIIADEDFRFPPDTKTEVLRQKWRRMRKDDPKLSIILSGPSRLADEMLGLGGTSGGVPLAALEDVSLVAPVGVPPPPDDICPPPPEGSPLTAPDGVPCPPPPPNDLPLVASDDLHLRTLMAQRQQRAAPFVFTPQLELDLKRGVYRHNSHSNKWTRIIADEDFRFPPDTKTEVLRQKWRRMCKDDPKLSILLSGPSRLADEMLGVGGTPGCVPLAALEGVSLVAPVGVPPPPDDICPPPPDGSPLTAPDGFPPPPPPQ
ncbi:hypothetical protein KIW84_050794 [Lathyrus oleraceus]|uniref:Uncharacterized protein n=1 Tax=Pisum sativum TaxID=3888 RepID=A0A9D5ACL1_PEA|nr:hypothetical protein KIW84_050794 [Pisum sativum]